MTIRFSNQLLVVKTFSCKRTVFEAKRWGTSIFDICCRKLRYFCLLRTRPLSRWCYLSVMAPHITCNSTVCSTVCYDNYKGNIKALLLHYWPFVNGIHRWPFHVMTASWRQCHRMYFLIEYTYTHISRVSCQKGPICHALACLVGPFWQDTIDMW